MAIKYNGNVMGKIVVTQNEHDFELEIRQGNCLAVIIYSNKENDGTFTHTLMQFFANEKHLKKECNAVDKGEDRAPIFYDVKSIRLNMCYNECFILLKHLVKYYEITCYYE